MGGPHVTGTATAFVLAKAEAHSFRRAEIDTSSTEDGKSIGS